MVASPQHQRVRRNNAITIDFLNTKLQYWEVLNANQTIQRFEDTWLEICRLQGHLHTIRLLLRFDTTMAARLWLRRDDIAARMAGEAILIWFLVLHQIF